MSSAACRDRGSSRTSPNGEAPPGLRSPAIRDPSSRRSHPLISSHAHLSLASVAARLRSSFRVLFNERASTACSPPTPRHDISCPAVAVSPPPALHRGFSSSCLLSSPISLRPVSPPLPCDLVASRRRWDLAYGDGGWILPAAQTCQQNRRPVELSQTSLTWTEIGSHFLCREWAGGAEGEGRVT